VALVKSAYRKKQTVVLTNLDGMLDYEIGMLTTVIVGSSHTRLYDGRIFTPRGYDAKYTSDGTVREGQTPGRSLVVAASEDAP
jgi:precorrin-3B C17-methyltransferase